MKAKNFCFKLQLAIEISFQYVELKFFPKTKFIVANHKSAEKEAKCLKITTN